MMSYYPNNSRSFKFGRVKSTVAILWDGSCKELRRGDITWTRAVKEAIPPIQQQRWATLTSWYATLPVEMAPVEEWHIKADWNGPRTEAAAGEALYSLSTHLAYFMRRNTATAAQIVEAIQSYETYQTKFNRWHINGDPVLCGFFGLPAWGLADKNVVTACLTEGQHLFELGSASGPEWPSVTSFNLSGKRPILSYVEGELEFSPEMMYFMGGWPTGTWADVQRVYEAYVGHRIGAATHPRVEEGSIVTDTFLRHLLQTKERLMPWSTFRRLLIGRGLVWNSALPALVVEPVEVARPVERRLSFGAPMEIDEGDGAPVAAPAPAAEPVVAAPSEAAPAAPSEVEFPTGLPAVAVPAAPSEAEINAFMSRVEAQKLEPIEEPAPAPAADPFVELDDLWTQVWDEMETVDDCAYHIALMEELLTICLRDEYAVAWRTNTFKRIQMRAALRIWAEVHGEVEIVNRFLLTYPA